MAMRTLAILLRCRPRPRLCHGSRVPLAAGAARIGAPSGLRRKVGGTEDRHRGAPAPPERELRPAGWSCAPGPNLGWASTPTRRRPGSSGRRKDVPRSPTVPDKPGSGSPQCRSKPPRILAANNYPVQRRRRALSSRHRRLCFRAGIAAQRARAHSAGRLGQTDAGGRGGGESNPRRHSPVAETVWPAGPTRRGGGSFFNRRQGVKVSCVDDTLGRPGLMGGLAAEGRRDVQARWRTLPGRRNARGMTSQIHIAVGLGLSLRSPPLPTTAFQSHGQRVFLGLGDASWAMRRQPHADTWPGLQIRSDVRRRRSRRRPRRSERNGCDRSGAPRRGRAHLGSRHSQAGRARRLMVRQRSPHRQLRQARR